jgi:receptor protein-tyrosine kinase/non-specific protein-tyrosine kinase
MNRIQQILSKAERDGTARPVSTLEDEPREMPPPVVLRPREEPRRVVRQEEEPEADENATFDGTFDETFDSVSYAVPPPSANVTAAAALHPVLVAALDPMSAAAEQYRSLRSRIAQAQNGNPLRVLQVTSPGKNDGKTVTTLNLALTMAQEFQRRVLVIDADLRQPGVHALLGLTPGPGLVDVLTGAATLHDALIELPEHHLTVLRAGRAYERPAEMLGSGPMRHLVDTLRTQFDRVVVDSAPAMVADPGAIAPLVDGLLLVVRASATTKPAIARAISTLATSKLLGLVFNESGAPLQGQYSASA